MDTPPILGPYLAGEAEFQLFRRSPLDVDPPAMLPGAVMRRTEGEEVREIVRPALRAIAEVMRFQPPGIASGEGALEAVPFEYAMMAHQNPCFGFVDTTEVLDQEHDGGPLVERAVW